MPSYEYRHRVTLEETNAVGNVYFSRHLAWQGRCRELFLFDHCPEILDALNRGRLHLVTREVSCSYQQEIFAGDLIAIRMRLERQTASRMWLDFEYVRLVGEAEERVATGKHVIGCLGSKTEGAPPTPIELPAPLVAAAGRYAMEEAPPGRERERR